MTVFSADTMPDLIDEAALGFELSAARCGSCATYHGIRGYLRTTGDKAGAAFDHDRLGQQIRAHVGDGGRLLIAGSADSGLFALAARATTGLDVAIVVADQCATPLELVQYRARRIGRPVTTAIADLTQIAPAGPFDLVVAHAILQFIAPAQQRGFLTTLADRLGPTGRLLLVNHNRSNGSRQRVERGDSAWVASVLDRMATGGVPQPGDAKRFGRLLAEFAAEQSRLSQVERHLGADRVAALLLEAGLTVVDRWETDGRTDREAAAGAAEPATKRSTYFIARR